MTAQKNKEMKPQKYFFEWNIQMELLRFFNKGTHIKYLNMGLPV